LIDLKLDHVGLVVPKLEPALEQLSSQLGFEWIGRYEPVISMHRPGRGTQDMHLRISLSVQVPRLEVIEALPDSPWALGGNEGMLHHLAYYADDLTGESRRLAVGACPIEICGVKADGTMPTTFTYHHILKGFRIELLQDRTS
jgi:hypothetical protein